MNDLPLPNFWTFGRTRRFGFALLLGVAIAFVAEIVLLKRTGGLMQEGDFPAFYSAAILVADHSLETLYSRQQQSEVQNIFWPSEKKEFLAFAYPPYVALLIRPLAKLSPDRSKLTFTAMMLLCFSAGIFLLWRLSNEPHVSFLFLLGLGLSFPPSFTGVIAGQNIGVLLLLFSAGVSIAENSRSGAQIVAGICFGAMAIKPQYAAIIGLFLLCQRNWKMLFGMGLSIGSYYLIAAVFFGWDWPLLWLAMAQGFVIEDYDVNGVQMVSLAALTRMLTNGGTFWYVVLGLLGIPLLLLSLRPYWRDSNLSREKILFLGVCALLFTPQTLYYDLPLAVFPVLMIGDISTDKKITWAVVGLVFSFCLLPLRGNSPLEPLAILLLFSFFFGLRKIWASSK